MQSHQFNTVAKIRFINLLAIAACILTGCTGDSSHQQPGTSDETQKRVLTVYVVNYPLQYFAKRIGGEHVAVVFPAPTDEDPAYWRPDAETIAAFQQADLILLNGASYAKWIKTATLPESIMVDTSAGFADQYIHVKDAVTHSHGPGAQHAHTGTAFTTWLDPVLAIDQAKSIAESLIKRLPNHKAAFQEGLVALEADLKGLDQQLSSIIEGESDRAVCFSHPVYQYLLRRHQLNAISVHWEPDTVPSPKQWDELSGKLEQHPAKWMIWEGEPNTQNVKQLEEIGLQSTVFDPCGNAPEQGDFLSVMRGNLKNLGKVFSE